MEGTDRRTWLTASMARRGIHLVSPLFLGYYLLPAHFAGVDRQLFVVIAVVLIIGVESVRLLFHLSLPGLRDYEQHRLAAYAWGGFGMAIGFLFFPPVLHVVTYSGMAWIDPLARWARDNSQYPRVPLLAYLAMAAVLLVLFFQYEPKLATNPILIVPFAIIGAAVAVAVEYPKWTVTDDDFAMNIVPLLMLTLLLGP